MTYFPDGMIPPPVSLDTAAFWDAAKEHRFVLQRCEDCQKFQHPPGPVCHRCRASNLIWSEVEGRGTVYTYTWVHKAFVPALQDLLPYAVAVIELPAAESIRFVSNVVDVTPVTLTVGLPVELVWDDYAELSVPRFRPSA